MSTPYKSLATKLIHAGEPEPRINGAVSMPIFQSTMFEYAGETNYHDLKYIRLNNTPNHLALHKKLAALENAEDALDPHACFLLPRGMKTLAVRLRQQNESALQIARFLEKHSAIAKVNYPGLESHPRHQRARELFDGSSGMLSFEMKGGLQAAERFMENTTLPIIAPSLGGIETLLTRPALTSHAGMSPHDRLRLGITDG